MTASDFVHPALRLVHVYMYIPILQLGVGGCGGVWGGGGGGVGV